jgi:galactitol-specific phosphotransferase system IIB component
MKIAIEPALTNVKDYLAGKGYDVESLNSNERFDMNTYDAIVVTGLNTNLLGIHDTETKAVVINADGLTPPEVAKQLENVFQPV